MSKVIRDGAGFVPEKLIAADDYRPAIWENLAKQEEPVLANHPDQSKSLPSVQGHKNKEGRNEIGNDSHSFDNDFSSPDSEHSANDHSDNNEVQPQSDTAPQIDTEALAEEFFNKGVQAGIERTESDYRLSIKTLQSICEELDVVRETILKNSLAEMRDLVLRIAEKIIRHSVSNQNQTILDTVEEAIIQAVKSDEFIIAINPKDYETVKSHSTDFINAVNGLQNIIVKSDNTVEQGGCLVESSNCTVDATLPSQLEIISDAVKNS